MKRGRGRVNVEEEGESYQHQHVWNGDDVGLVPHRHAGLEEVPPVLLVRHRVVGMKCDVVLLTAFPESQGNKKGGRGGVSLLLPRFETSVSPLCRVGHVPTVKLYSCTQNVPAPTHVLV